jgi:hypothetical protein
MTRSEINGPVIVNVPDMAVPYKWTTTGATGTMLITVRSGEIAQLKVTFD